jgi:hypothetical protein
MFEMSEIHIIFNGEFDDRSVVAVCSTLDKAKELAKTLKIEDIEYQIETFEVDKVFQKFYFYECSILDDKYRKTLEIIYSELEGNDIIDNSLLDRSLDWTENFPFNIQAYGFYGKGTTKEESLKNTKEIREKFYLEKDQKLIKKEI